MKDRPPPEVCPVCGETIPRKAKACPECGSCHESGWNEDESVADAPDYGYGDNVKFDHSEWLAREEGRARLPGAIHPAWKWAVVIVLIALAILAIAGR